MNYNLIFQNNVFLSRLVDDYLKENVANRTKFEKLKKNWLIPLIFRQFISEISIFDTDFLNRKQILSNALYDAQTIEKQAEVRQILIEKSQEQKEQERIEYSKF